MRNWLLVAAFMIAAPGDGVVDGADLTYASNTGSTVILANGMYYLVEDGVWYVSSTPNGPWLVSDHRPAQVISIQPTSPVYNVRYVYVYDSIWTNKFIPFWWSPETAFGDMAARPVSYENGEYKLGKPFDNPEMIDFMGLGPRRMVDHEHEEPVTFGIFFKGLKSANFKYGGKACDLAEYLFFDRYEWV